MLSARVDPTLSLEYTHGSPYGRWDEVSQVRPQSSYFPKTTTKRPQTSKPTARKREEALVQSNNKKQIGENSGNDIYLKYMASNAKGDKYQRLKKETMEKIVDKRIYQAMTSS